MEKKEEREKVSEMVGERELTEREREIQTDKRRRE